ncbi:MAG TPA: hypothetical protein VKR06_13200 [Ktedonosporobacter sp.]|nr:hypothetical protein [Ktedonosporobacter sp.]
MNGNEPRLQADLTTYFADPQAQCQQAETTDRHRGRVEHRLIPRQSGVLSLFAS